MIKDVIDEQGAMPEMAGAQPTLQIDEKEVPAASDYEIGDEVTATIKGKVTAKDNGSITIEYSGAECELTSDMMKEADRRNLKPNIFKDIMKKRAAKKGGEVI